VDTPFGKSMIARGLLGETARDGGVDADGGTVDPTLRAALAAMRKDGVDSDGDGAEDLDELSWYGDPNHYDGLRPNDIPQVNYGCHMARHSGSEGNLFAAVLGVMLAVARRRR
jgi:MYXO-CTERM domain-containing protein